ncbi:MULTISPECIES: hypothetical protein [unclassified Mesorhizobium]|uniref:hypothetical protein n=1 Tax=unclassified Mesorhizobium TaxID=325217 RepID=UPI000404F667|nr:MULTISPECIES: hypothetical protein [unclassified Mesorhizobium]WJI47658.1 hypothetical protein NL532_13990 [Mesorhizobium sp. C120A]WJI84008.1 hypothetical protein NLY34_15225 [Mesorhizobium sp. C374B]WJI84797.1 hypothetical protein NLY42_17635 [Mesorhizobium sp. C372A]
MATPDVSAVLRKPPPASAATDHCDLIISKGLRQPRFQRIGCIRQPSKTVHFDSLRNRRFGFANGCLRQEDQD